MPLSGNAGYGTSSIKIMISFLRYWDGAQQGYVQDFILMSGFQVLALRCLELNSFNNRPWTFLTGAGCCFYAGQTAQAKISTFTLIHARPFTVSASYIVKVPE